MEAPPSLALCSNQSKATEELVEMEMEMEMEMERILFIHLFTCIYFYFFYLLVFIRMYVCISDACTSVCVRMNVCGYVYLFPDTYIYGETNA
jgi:hypothetical protein